MRVRVVIATMLCLLVGTAARAQASEVDVAGDGFALTSTFGLSGGSGGSSSSAQVVVRSVAVCSSTGVVARCLRVPLVCPAGEHVVARYRGSSSLPAPPGPGWTYLGQSCSGGSQPVPGLTLNDFLRLPLPSGAFTLQPPWGGGLLRMGLNV